MRRRILAMTLAILLSGISLPGQTVPIGVISQSAGAHLNNSSASVGTTVYDSGRLSTEANGSLILRSSAMQLILSEYSALVVNPDDRGLRAMLQRGTVTFRIEAGGALRLNAVDVLVRPQTGEPTAGQMTLENCAVLVASRLRGLEVTAGAETKIVEEGKSYRVLLKGSCNDRKNTPPLLSCRADLSPSPLRLALSPLFSCMRRLRVPSARSSNP
jgi:hypothetical protein